MFILKLERFFMSQNEEGISQPLQESIDGSRQESPAQKKIKKSENRGLTSMIHMLEIYPYLDLSSSH